MDSRGGCEPDRSAAVAAAVAPVKPVAISAMSSAARPTEPAPANSGPGYENRNGQITIRATGLVGTDHGQYVYVLRCLCGNEYGANGSDIHIRRCPVCQGGRPGLPY